MTKKITKVVIEHKLDTDADTSYLGQYTDQPEDHAIIRVGEHAGKFVSDLRQKNNLPERGREFRFFLAYAAGETPGSRAYRKYARQDFKRMESLEQGHWHFIGIRAYAVIDLGASYPQRIESGGLWGIESDSGKKELKQVEKDELGQLSDALKALGFGEREIKAAFKAAERKEE